MRQPPGAAVAALCAALLVLVPAARPALAQEITVAARMVDDLKAVFGTVESVDQSLARARIGGTIAELRIDEGSRVAAGGPVARVDDPKLPLQLAALDSRIESARSQSALAKVDLERIAKLRATGTASQAALDSAQTGLAVSVATLAALRAERAVVAEQIAEGAVLAPATGRVLQVRVTEGQVVLPGETIAVIAAETYVLRLHLPERHARFLGEGDPVLVGERGLAEDGAGLRQGRVRQVYPEMDRGRVVADVEVEGLGDFFVGERTRVYVATGKRAAIVVPPDYLYRRYGLSYARLKGGEEVVVQVGAPLDDGIEVLSGLAPGDVLVRP